MTLPLGEARAILGDAERIVVLSGAGLSAESGVPTFRGAEGLWKRHRPEDLATPGAFRRDPRLVWEWYAWRRELVGRCDPNAGHLAIARRAARGGLDVVTQNVDGLHGRAARAVAGPEVASGPVVILELHGSLFRDRCHSCRARLPAGPVDTSSPESLPRCAACGGPLRPDVVWFGEALDAHVLSDAFEWAARADVCLVVGTSALVQPAASVPLATLRAGGSLIEVNPSRTPLSGDALLTLHGPAAELLPQILD